MPFLAEPANVPHVVIVVTPQHGSCNVAAWPQVLPFVQAGTAHDEGGRYVNVEQCPYPTKYDGVEWGWWLGG